MRIYCASDIGDLFEVVQYLHSKYPLAFIVSIGVSLGGYVFNVLLILILPVPYTQFCSMYTIICTIIFVMYTSCSMILTQYLHQLGKECDINVAISISACWDPFISRESLEEKKINKLLYSRVLVNNIKAIVEKLVELSYSVFREQNIFIFSNSHLRLEEREKLPLNIKGVMEVKNIMTLLSSYLQETCMWHSCMFPGRSGV